MIDLEDIDTDALERAIIEWAVEGVYDDKTREALESVRESQRRANQVEGNIVLGNA